MSHKIKTPMSGVTAVQMQENAWFGGLSIRRGFMFEAKNQTWVQKDWYQFALKSGLGA